ncbi:MAG TPA: sigma-70 family RNA polymerase sigma factor [Candidatus Binatia bacterium]|nr:sigma-70 family RNA polymerase sigma factor [Candidatus Binatia bacterium]
MHSTAKSATSGALVGIADLFDAHRKFLWGLSYRLTGSAADADDIVQETFVRAMERPPDDTSQPWRPWLVRVALNLGRDLLRRRRRRSYVGPWLPAPIETGDEASPPTFEPVVDGEHTTEGRYDLLESVSFAFLLALEALTPQQRAVLLLRDVFDYSVRDTAAALGLTEPNVKTTHHRARAAMRDYDRARCVPTRALQEQTREVLAQFMSSLLSGDVPTIEAMLAESVRGLSDGGGEFFAARKPLIGRQRVLRFHWNIWRRRMAEARFAARIINGLPAVVGQFVTGKPGEPPRVVFRCDIDGAGRIVALHSVVATRKLTGVDFASLAV